MKRVGWARWQGLNALLENSPIAGRPSELRYKQNTTTRLFAVGTT